MLYRELLVHGSRLRAHVMTDTSLEERLQSFIESEGKSCSFDPELITPEYVFRSWGGKFSIEKIENGLAELRNKGVFMVHGS